MTVKEFLKDFNQMFASQFIVEMHDITSNTKGRYGAAELMQHDLHTDWRNAKIWCWTVDVNELVLTVEKSAEKAEYIADCIEQFMFERGEYDYRGDYHIPVWLGKSREATTVNILNDILAGNTEPLIEYLESEIDVMETGEIFDECADIARRALEKLKEV